MKETLEFRSQVNNGGSNRGVRVTTEHIAGLGGSTQSNYDDLGEPAYKGQDGFAAPSPHSSNIKRTINPEPSSHRNIKILCKEIFWSQGLSVRGSDLPYSQLGTSSMPSRYRSAASSSNVPTISMYESLRPGGLPLPEASSVLPQHLTDRQSSQPTYEQIANTFGYPIPAKSSSHTASALQQAYVGGTGLDQTVAGMKYSFPQQRNGVSMSRVPPTPGARGHGRFGTSTNVHGNYSHNSSVAPVRDFVNVFPSQYNDGHQLTHLRQSTRALPSVQDRAYNNLHGQNQHYAGYRQEQSRQVPSQSQHYESMGYPNYFTSQLGTTHEHQGQRLNDSHFRPGIPDLPPQEWQQLWSRKY